MTQNFKNVLQTLATRHQHMVAYYLSAPTFFEPHQQSSRVTSVTVSDLPEVAQEYIKNKTNSRIIYSTSKFIVDGTTYSPGMFLSVGEDGGLPQFSKIEKILLVNNDVAFL